MAMIPHVIVTPSTVPAMVNNKMLPPTTRACRRLPRRQMVIVASITKITSNSKLNWATNVQGFGTPVATTQTRSGTDGPDNGDPAHSLAFASFLKFILLRASSGEALSLYTEIFLRNFNE